MKVFSVTATSIILFFLPLVARCEVVDRIIAIVNDDIVTLKETEKYVHVEKRGRFVSVDEYLRNMRIRDKLDSVIDDVLIKQQAKKLRIEVHEKEVEDVVESIKRQHLITDAELREQLAKQDTNYQDFLEGIKTNLFRSRVLSRVLSAEINVTENDLKDYYDKHKDEFKEEEYRLQQIFVSHQKPDAQKRIMTAYDHLKQGQSFEAVSKDFSDDPMAAKTGGDIGLVRRDDLIPQLRAAVSQLSPGIYTDVLATPYGFHILRLVEVKTGGVMSYESVKGKLHERIVQEESEKRYKDYVNKLRKSSYIEVKI